MKKAVLISETLSRWFTLVWQWLSCSMLSAISYFFCCVEACSSAPESLHTFKVIYSDPSTLLITLVTCITVVPRATSWRPEGCCAQCCYSRSRKQAQARRGSKIGMVEWLTHRAKSQEFLVSDYSLVHWVVCAHRATAELGTRLQMSACVCFHWGEMGLVLCHVWVGKKGKQCIIGIKCFAVSCWKAGRGAGWFYGGVQLASLC